MKRKQPDTRAAWNVWATLSSPSSPLPGSTGRGWGGGGAEHCPPGGLAGPGPPPAPDWVLGGTRSSCLSSLCAHKAPSVSASPEQASRSRPPSPHSPHTGTSYGSRFQAAFLSGTVPQQQAGTKAAQAGVRGCLSGRRGRNYRGQRARSHTWPCSQQPFFPASWGS